GSLTPAECEAIKAEYLAALESNLEKAKAREAEKTARRKAKAADPQAKFAGSTAVFQPDFSHAPVPTGVPHAEIEKVVRGLTTLPAGFNVNPKIRRLLDARLHALKEGGPVDWALARRSPSAPSCSTARPCA
ncbi:MAG: hypothetical protein LC118_15005, partial [Dehalococcoidia bacterium]|nr:hypothetical protein [Dehalococcoidia bacterium]